MEGTSLMSDSNITEKKSRIRNKKSNDGVVVSTNRRNIAVTSFDLLNGEYAITERNKRIFSVITVIGVLMIVFLGYQVVNVNLENNNLVANKLLLDEEKRKLEARFTQTTGIPEGITQSDLISNFNSFENDFQYISYVTAFPFDLLNVLKSNNIYITSVNTKIVYSKPKEGEESKGRENPNDIPAELLSEVDIDDIIKNDSIPIYYKIVATALTPLDLAEWAKRVRDANIFNEMTIVSSGNIYTVHGIVSQATPPSVIAKSWSEASLPIKKPKQETGTILDETIVTQEESEISNEVITDETN